MAAATPFDGMRVKVACVGTTISEDDVFPRGIRCGSKCVGHGLGSNSSPFRWATSSSDRAQEAKRVKNRTKIVCKEKARLEVGLLHENIHRVRLRRCRSIPCWLHRMPEQRRSGIGSLVFFTTPLYDVNVNIDRRTHGRDTVGKGTRECVAPVGIIIAGSRIHSEHKARNSSPAAEDSELFR